jgi:hypothetical protein
MDELVALRGVGGVYETCIQKALIDNTDLWMISNVYGMKMYKALSKPPVLLSLLCSGF